MVMFYHRWVLTYSFCSPQISSRSVAFIEQLIHCMLGARFLSKSQGHCTWDFIIEKQGIACRGLKIRQNQPTFFLVWCWSVLKHQLYWPQTSASGVCGNGWGNLVRAHWCQGFWLPLPRESGPKLEDSPVKLIAAGLKTEAPRKCTDNGTEKLELKRVLHRLIHSDSTCPLFFTHTPTVAHDIITIEAVWRWSMAPR